MVFNETILAEVPFLSPVFESIHNIIESLQWLVGGMFGLYLILIFLRWREAYMVKKVLSEIRKDLRELADDIRNVNEKVNRYHDEASRKKKR